MIVVSGALVLLALALLIAGLFVSGGLTLVYASIAVSVVSAGFLALGVRQRRGEELTFDVPPGPGPSTPVAPGAAAPAEPAAAPEPPPAAPPAPEPPPPAPPVPTSAPAPVPPSPVPSVGAPPVVLVVPGRPRYHVAGCRYLAGRETEERTPTQARAEGFTACGVCRPDGTVPTAVPDEPDPPAADPPDDPPDPPTGEPVVVAPGRNRFHRPGCRYVREVAGAAEMTRAAARGQGLEACGVCKP